MIPVTRSRTRSWVTAVLAVVILLPALFGFGTKFREFLVLFWGDSQGSYALVPILNYLLASLGFMMLFLWAILHGMFRDIEQPKYTMLENEQRLDQIEEEQRHEETLGQAWED
jgi:hypothetical protein